MEGKKNGTVGARNKSTRSSSSNSNSSTCNINYSTLDELFGRKETNCNYNTKVKSSNSPSSNSHANSSAAAAGGGYFSTVFPHPNPPNYHLAGNDPSHSDLHWTLNHHRVDGKTNNGNSSKNQLASYTKDGKAAYSTESAESSHFGSSVHYGGRDFYATSPSKYAPPELPKTHKINDDNDNDNDNESVATRGDWWQGSLYY